MAKGASVISIYHQLVGLCYLPCLEHHSWCVISSLAEADTFLCQCFAERSARRLAFRLQTAMVTWEPWSSLPYFIDVDIGPLSHRSTRSSQLLKQRILLHWWQATLDCGFAQETRRPASLGGGQCKLGNQHNRARDVLT
jgi:hypothetical protein